MTQPYYQDEWVQLFHGDCLEVLRDQADASVDSVVTDPWYGSRGGALGVATLVDVHRRSSCLDYDDENDELRPCSLWASTDEYHLVLANPRPFTVPIPYRGRLGLWEFPDELLPEVAW